MPVYEPVDLMTSVKGDVPSVVPFRVRLGTGDNDEMIDIIPQRPRIGLRLGVRAKILRAMCLCIL